MISGALAAAATPLRDDGGALDEDGFGPLVSFLAAAGLDGLLALGTTGEGILLSVPERKRVTECFLEAAAGSLQVAAHCGAQTTADTVALAAHAAEAGVDAVAVIAPPYFPLDDRALLAHFTAAATACAPVPFYVYEFERTSGYAVPPHLIEELRERGAEPGGDEGLGLAVGALPAVPDRGARRLRRAGGADPAGHGRRRRRCRVGARDRVPRARARRRALAQRRGHRAGSASCAPRSRRFPRHAALKHVLRARGVAINEDVRRPLRGLTDDERARLDELLPAWLEAPAVR